MAGGEHGWEEDTKIHSLLSRNCHQSQNQETHRHNADGGHGATAGHDLLLRTQCAGTGQYWSPEETTVRFYQEYSDWEVN